MRRGMSFMSSSHNARKGLSFALWLTVTAISGAGSVASVRLSTPLSLDERGSAIVLYFVIPGILIALLWRLSRAAGRAIAAAIPFAWLFISRDEADTPLLWLVPVVAAGGVYLLSRRRAATPAGRGTSSSPWRAAVAAIVAALVLLLPIPERPNPDLRVVLIGWDGATWNVIDPLLDAGKMPNVARLEEHGHRAKLRSLPSLFSPQIWTTMCTGCLPEIHGIVGWTNRESDLRVGRIWDQLKREGRSFGLCDWYFTWPPEPGDRDRDFIIPTHLAPNSLTFPEDYFFYRVVEDFHKLSEKENVGGGGRIMIAAGLEAWRHGVRLSTIRRALGETVMRRLGRRNKLDRKWRDRLLYASLESDVFAELLRTRRVEFAAVLFTQIDTVSHVYWKYMDPRGFDEVTEEDVDRYGKVILDVYEECDRGLGEILKFVPPGADVMLVSDHGFESLGERIAGKSCRIRTMRLIASMGLEDKMFGTNVGKEVFLWSTADTQEEKEEILERAEPMLRAAHVESETRPLFDVARVGESIHLSLAPRDTLPEESYVFLNGHDVRFRGVVRATASATESGTHKPDGIYLLSGPSARLSVVGDSLNVVDVTPTIAAILGLPFSPLWTGHPAVETGSTRLATAEDYPVPGGSGEEPERVNEGLIERLRALGYLE
jgi:hypothetical protein